MTKAFAPSKEVLASATVLVHPHHYSASMLKRPTSLTADASETAQLTVLIQFRDNIQKQLDFCNGHLRPTEMQLRGKPLESEQ